MQKEFKLVANARLMAAAAIVASLGAIVRSRLELNGISKGHFETMPDLRSLGELRNIPNESIPSNALTC